MNRSEPLVSVVMANYNNERFIGEAIQSVLDQTYTNWEMIIVDDASKDRSRDVIQSFSDPRIRLFQNETNMQISFSRNFGYRMAEGDYIAHLDSDDTWGPEKLEKQVRWMEEHPETGVCFTWVHLMDEQGKRVEDKMLDDLLRTENRPGSAWIHDLLLHGNCLADDSCLMRRSTLKRIEGSRLALLQLQDLERWVRVLLKEEIYVIQEPLLNYRRVGDGSSISTPNPEKYHRHYLEMAWIAGNTIRGMEGHLFREAFRAEMKHPEAETPAEIEIEKALLLCSNQFKNDGVKLYGFEMMEKILREPQKTDLLRTEYGYSQLDLYRMTGKPILHDPMSKVKEDQLRNRAIELEGKIQLMENSRWWKLGAPLRDRKAGRS